MLLKLPTLLPCLRIWRCQLLSEPEIEVKALRGLSMMSLGDKRLSLRNHGTTPPAWEWVWLRSPRTKPKHSLRIFFYLQLIVSHIMCKSKHCLILPPGHDTSELEDCSPNLQHLSTRNIVGCHLRVWEKINVFIVGWGYQRSCWISARNVDRLKPHKSVSFPFFSLFGSPTIAIMKQYLHTTPIIIHFEKLYFFS